MTYLISVIVTTFNREDALEAVLSTLSRQSDQAFEVVVADDGSRAMTAAAVERWPIMRKYYLALPFRIARNASRRLRRRLRERFAP